MQLKDFEIEVLKVMINDRLTDQQWGQFLSNHTFVDYNYTGAGYYLTIKGENLRIAEGTLHKPTLYGDYEKEHVGFLVHIENDFVTIECHGWGDENPPENMREFNYVLSAG